MSTTAQEPDARSLNGPAPILRVEMAITGMTQGQVLRMLATNPGPRQDFYA